jgi:DNA helicase-2/ATP-dependent DNA helicase PcrA
MQHVTKIYGPPGTGKTTELISRLDDELRRGTPLRQIAYLSHTKAAADVIRDRFIADKTRKLVARDAAYFRTIHSACVRQLGIGLDNIVDQSRHYREFTHETGLELVPEYDLNDYTDESEFALNYNIVLRAHHLSLAKRVSLEEVCQMLPQHAFLTAEKREHFLQQWQRFKRVRNLWDFSDMLWHYLQNENAAPLPCKVVFLDEAQDLSTLQWAVFNKMVQGAECIYMAGDDDQAIYGFIGGSEYGFLEYAGNTNQSNPHEVSCEEIVLERSHRVPKAIGQRADAIIGQIEHRKPKSVQWRDEPGRVERMNLAPLAMPWKAWTEQGKTVMVLTRHRKQAWSFSNALARIGVPHGMGGQALQNSKEAALVRDYARVAWGARVRPNILARVLEALFGDDAKRTSAKLRSLAAKDQETLVSAADYGIDLGDKVNWPHLFAKGNKTLEKRFERLRDMVNKNGIDVLGREPNITISTMHGAKGKEADTVIICPDCTDIVRRNLLEPSEIRLAYVSLTRARERVIILSPLTGTYINHLVNA